MINAIKAKWHKLMEKDCFTLFCYAIIATGGIYLIGSLISFGWLFDKIFFAHTNDAFMDFFNSIRDASLGLGSYTERKVIYPPMANLFFLLLSKITPVSYNVTDWDYRLSWTYHRTNIVLICAFILICTFIFSLLIYASLKSSRKNKLLFVAVAVFSVPFLNMLERGNIMVIAFLFLLVYALTYDSKSAALRELGLIALAFSFSIKLYPALFAWVLIADKRYREFFRCIIYCLILLILPSFAFGGPSCLLLILENIFSFSTGSSGVLSVISRYAKIPSFLVQFCAYTLFVLCGLCFAASTFIYKEEKDKWKIWMLGCITFLSFPSLSSTYAWALFLIPLMRIFKKGMKGKDIPGYFIPLTVPFLFLPIPLPMHLTANAIALYVCIFAMTVYTIYDTVNAWKNIRKAKAAK